MLDKKPTSDIVISADRIFDTLTDKTKRFLRRRAESGGSLRKKMSELPKDKSLFLEIESEAPHGLGKEDDAANVGR